MTGMCLQSIFVLFDSFQNVGPGKGVEIHEDSEEGALTDSASLPTPPTHPHEIPRRSPAHP